MNWAATYTPTTSTAVAAALCRMMAPRPRPSRPIRQKPAPDSTTARSTPGWLSAGAVMPCRSAAPPAKNEMNDAALPDGQRHGAEHGRLRGQDQRAPRDRGQRGPDHARAVLAGHRENTEHPGQQQAADHAGQRVVGQVAGRVPGVDPHRDADADGAGDRDRQGPPGGTQAAELDPFHSRRLRRAVTAAGRVGYCSVCHDVLPVVGRYSTAPLVSWKNASSSESAPADSSATVVSASSRPW